MLQSYEIEVGMVLESNLDDSEFVVLSKAGDRIRLAKLVIAENGSTSFGDRLEIESSALIYYKGSARRLVLGGRF